LAPGRGATLWNPRAQAAAAANLGANAFAALAILSQQLGLSHGKSVW